jgi:hypothetical protein
VAYQEHRVKGLAVFNLLAHDLTQLARTCKGLNKFAESRLWTHHEFHHLSIHQQCDKGQPPHITSGSARFYHWSLDRPGYWKARKLLEILHNLLSSDIDQFKAICARVRSICSVLKGGPNFWQLPSYFVNLETLEVHGCDQEAAEGRHAAFDAPAPPCPSCVLQS